MTLGFDSRNLDAAATVIIAHANKINQEHLVDGSGRTYLLSEPQQVREYLMSKAEAVYSRAKPESFNIDKGEKALIQGVLYYSIGVVFENAPDEIQPPLITSREGHPENMAMFW